MWLDHRPDRIRWGRRGYPDGYHRTDQRDDARSEGRLNRPIMMAAPTDRVVPRKSGYPKKDDVASLRKMPWLTAFFCCLCCLLVVDVPDGAWGQYSSGGYSRPGSGSGYGYAAPSRRMPVSSSGGYSRRSYSGTGYRTGSS